MPVLTCELNKEYEESIIMLIFIAYVKTQYLYRTERQYPANHNHLVVKVSQIYVTSCLQQTCAGLPQTWLVGYSSLDSATLPMVKQTSYLCMFAHQLQEYSHQGMNKRMTLGY